MFSKKLNPFILFFLLLMTANVSAQEPFPSTLSWRGQSLKLASQEKNTKSWVAEYIPPQQSLEHWSQLFGIWFYPGTLKAKDILQQKVNYIQLRKKSGDFAANYNIFIKKREDGSAVQDYAIDFLVSEPPLYEHSVYLFKDSPGGVLAYQYSRRYDPKLSGPDSIASDKALILSIVQEREGILKELARKDWPQWSKSTQAGSKKVN